MGRILTARAAPPTAASEIVMPYILHYGSAEQKQRLLPAMCSGELIGAIAMTEPGAGSDLQGVRTTAVEETPGGDYILNGSKVFITNGQMADGERRREPRPAATGTRALRSHPRPAQWSSWWPRRTPPRARTASRCSSWSAA